MDAAACQSYELISAMARKSEWGRRKAGSRDVVVRAEEKRWHVVAIQLFL
jgi:hypothetical protein